jgi:hypothetical protein
MAEMKKCVQRKIKEEMKQEEHWRHDRQEQRTEALAQLLLQRSRRLQVVAEMSFRSVQSCKNVPDRAARQALRAALPQPCH